MKRTLALLLALVMCLSLCACDNSVDNSADNSNEVKLTLENYSKYLSIKAKVGNPDIFDGGVKLTHNVPIEGGARSFVYKYFNITLGIEGVSTNFNYNDISITVRFSGTYKTYDDAARERDSGNKLDTELTAECNIAGEGSASTKFYPDGGYVLQEKANIGWEVVAISGTVTPVG